MRRFVVQSYFGSHARSGAVVKSEEEPNRSLARPGTRETVAAIRHLEAEVLGAAWTEGIVLRYGGFYGPGESESPPEATWRAGR